MNTRLDRLNENVTWDDVDKFLNKYSEFVDEQNWEYLFKVARRHAGISNVLYYYIGKIATNNPFQNDYFYITKGSSDFVGASYNITDNKLHSKFLNGRNDPVKQLIFSLQEAIEFIDEEIKLGARVENFQIHQFNRSQSRLLPVKYVHHITNSVKLARLDIVNLEIYAKHLIKDKLIKALKNDIDYLFKNEPVMLHDERDTLENIHCKFDLITDKISFKINENERLVDSLETQIIVNLPFKLNTKINDQDEINWWYDVVDYYINPSSRDRSDMEFSDEIQNIIIETDDFNSEISEITKTFNYLFENNYNHFYNGCFTLYGSDFEAWYEFNSDMTHEGFSLDLYFYVHSDLEQLGITV